MNKMNNEKGISLLETLLVVVVVGLMVFLLANIPNALGLVTKSRNLSLAREIALKQIEDKRTTAYINFTNGTVAISDSRFSLLPQSSGSITIEDCDPLICTNQEDIKKVTVIVQWMENNKRQSVNLTTFIGKEGLNQ